MKHYRYLSIFALISASIISFCDGDLSRYERRMWYVDPDDPYVEVESGRMPRDYVRRRWKRRVRRRHDAYEQKVSRRVARRRARIDAHRERLASREREYEDRIRRKRVAKRERMRGHAVMSEAPVSDSPRMKRRQRYRDRHMYADDELRVRRHTKRSSRENQSCLRCGRADCTCKQCMCRKSKTWREKRRERARNRKRNARSCSVCHRCGKRKKAFESQREPQESVEKHMYAAMHDEQIHDRRRTKRMRMCREVGQCEVCIECPVSHSSE